MRLRIFKYDSLMLLTACIWGFAFVAQRAGMEHVGPFIFNGIRFALGSLALIPVILVRSQQPSLRGIPPLRDDEATSKRHPERSEEPNHHPPYYCRGEQKGGQIDHSPPVPGGDLKGGQKNRAVRYPHLRANPILQGAILAGLALFGGATFQQIGIIYTTAGKAGFITGLYVIIVPILGMFWGQKTGVGTWLGAILATVGLYLLSITGVLAVNLGDGLVLVSALFWAIHVHIIGYFSPKVDPIKLASLQFAVCSVLSLLVSLIIETNTWHSIAAAAIPILYAGLASTGIAYTLQVVAQRVIPPSHAAIILSLEAVFAAIGGWLLLAEGLSFRGFLGCALMLAGMVVSQLHARAEPSLRTKPNRA
jgi:drug/metabolite transporter (DMT)-like permease